MSLNNSMYYLALLGIYFRRKNILADCGHLTKKKDTVTAFDEVRLCEIPLNEDGSTLYCHHCLEEMAIQCAWCGLPIFIGDAVTLYSSIDKSEEMPDYAVRYGDYAYVGCLRWNCVESGADRSGFLIPPGKVQRVLSPLEQCIQSGEMVIVGDVTDMSQAVLVDDNMEQHASSCMNGGVSC